MLPITDFEAAVKEDVKTKSNDRLRQEIFELSKTHPFLAAMAAYGIFNYAATKDHRCMSLAFASVPLFNSEAAKEEKTIGNGPLSRSLDPSNN